MAGRILYHPLIDITALWALHVGYDFPLVSHCKKSPRCCIDFTGEPSEFKSSSQSECPEAATILGLLTPSVMFLDFLKLSYECYNLIGLIFLYLDVL